MKRKRTDIPAPPKVTAVKREQDTFDHDYDLYVNGKHVGYVHVDRIQNNNDSFWPNDEIKHRYPKIPYVCCLWRAIELTCKAFGGYYVEQSGIINLDLTQEGMGWIVVKEGEDKPFVKEQMGECYMQVSVFHATTFVSRRLARECAQRNGGKVKRRNEYDHGYRWPEGNFWFENLPPNPTIEIRQSSNGSNSCYVYTDDTGTEFVVGMSGQRQASQQASLDAYAKQTLIRRRTVA